MKITAQQEFYIISRFRKNAIKLVNNEIDPKISKVINRRTHNKINIQTKEKEKEKIVQPEK